MLRLDQEFDAASGSWGAPDEAGAFESEHHLVDGWWRDLEVPLHVCFRGWASEDAAVSIDEGQVLTLFVAEGGRRRGHVPNI